MLAFLIIALIIAVLAIILLAQNPAAISVVFLFWTFHGSLALVLLITLIAGALISFFALMPNLIRHRLSIRSLRKRISNLESNVSSYKAKLDEAQKTIDEQKEATKQPESQPEEEKPSPSESQQANQQANSEQSAQEST